MPGMAYKPLPSPTVPLVRASVEEAAACGFQLWLYDEDNWPSGTAGGAVTAGHPEYRARYLQLSDALAEQSSVTLSPEGEFLGAWAIPVDPEGEASGDAVPLSPGDEGRIHFDPPDGRWRVCVFTVGDGGYVDLLNPEPGGSSTHARPLCRGRGRAFWTVRARHLHG